jgi:hypothetical protein
MLLIVEVAIVVLFPAFAVWAWRSGRRPRLSLVTALTLAFVVGLAVVLSTRWGGNRVVDVDGFYRTAARMELFFLLTGGLPLAGAALIVGLIGTRLDRPLPLYAVATVISLLMFVVGTTVAIYGVWR